MNFITRLLSPSCSSSSRSIESGEETGCARNSTHSVLGEQQQRNKSSNICMASSLHCLCQVLPSRLSLCTTRDGISHSDVRRSVSSTSCKTGQRRSSAVRCLTRCSLLNIECANDRERKESLVKVRLPVTLTEVQVSRFSPTRFGRRTRRMPSVKPAKGERSSRTRRRQTNQYCPRMASPS